MTTVSCSLLDRIAAHAPDRLALTVLETGERATFGDLVAIASGFRRSLARLGIRAGDSVASALPAGRNLVAMVLACWDHGVRLQLLPGAGDCVAGERVALTVVAPEAAGSKALRTRHVSVSELAEPTVAWSLPEPSRDPAQAALTTPRDDATETIGAAALARSIDNVRYIGPIEPGSTLLSLSPPSTLDGAFVSVVMPLALGMTVIVADQRIVGEQIFFDALAGADSCELPGPAWLALVRSEAFRPLPANVRAVICGSARLHPADLAEVEAALGRPLHCGFGTAETGLWALPRHPRNGERPDDTMSGSIRPLRSPLRLAGADAATGGEIVLSGRDDAREYRTGAVGWSTPSGRIEIAGALSDVVVRGGRALLLSDTDRLLASHRDVRECRTFREHGATPIEAAVATCITSASPAEIGAWLAARGPEVFVPERIVTIPPGQCRSLPATEVLRTVVGGQAGRAVIAALTARRFRRNPAYDEKGLAAAVDRALLGNRPLDFLMFWGCGPRRMAAAPDRAAIDALADLLAAAEAIAPLRARAHIVCTDGHATNNGHAEVHYATYFAEIAALAAGLDVTFELESAVWRRGGLTKSRITALEEEPSFAVRWERFPLKDRFVQQASRHSGMADKIAAARHYYATCLLEREVLKTQFAGSVFLTYNGPEFNECFPDLPTLYIFPGPRGRTVKPWFVEVVDGPLGSGRPEVAAA